MKITQLLIFSLITINSFSQVSEKIKNVFGNDPKHGKYLEHRGFKMYYEVYGQGAPLLMIHGNGGSIKSLENQIPFFPKNIK